MTGYFLGVDIGGTKSHALIADAAGQALGFGAGGAGNYESVGFTGLVETTQTIIDEALHMAGIAKSSLTGAGFGVAGYDWPSERPLTLDAINTLGLTCPHEVVNDAIVGLLAGSKTGWGVAVVAGTGENCWGWNRDRKVGRVTGNGMRLGEFGGAGTVVCRAVHEVSKAWSLRGPKTALTQAFIIRTGATDETDLMEGLALNKYRITAEDAPLVIEMAEGGDAVAEEILQWAGKELAGLTIGVIRQLEFQEVEFEIVLVGSMFKGGHLLVEPMQEAVCRVAPGAKFVPLEVPPVLGGVLLGMECAGLEAFSVRDSLVESTKQLLLNIEDNRVEFP